LVNRKDIVAQYGSAQKASKSGIYHSWNQGAESLKLKKKYLNPISFSLYALNCLEVKKNLLSLIKSHDAYTIIYENFLEDPVKEIRNLIFFLKLKNFDINIESKKLLPLPDLYIANYKSLKKIENWISKKHRSKSIPIYIKYISRLYNSKQKASYWFKKKILA
jgi:hypothetical protein